MKKKHLVIIGGGFAGVNLAKALRGAKQFDITLVDKNNYNFFPPLLYQVATSFLEPSSISYPFRKLLSGGGCNFRLASLISVVPKEHKVVLSNGELQYDYLVFTTGAVSNYFGNQNIEQHAVPMKTLADAVAMRNRMLLLLEEASIATTAGGVKKGVTVVIAGGGPTGVEIAGMFAEMRKSVIAKEYPQLEAGSSQIYLVDGGKALLGAMSPASGTDTLLALEKLGVKVVLDCTVKDFSNDEVLLSTGEVIKTKTLIWAAGITAQIIEGIAAESYGRGRRMQVNGCNAVQGYTDIYAIGDTCISITDTKYPAGHPQVAQVAIQQGKWLAKNLANIAEGKMWRPFVYADKGSMAIIGKGKAVVDLFKNKLHLSGVFAWLAWLFVHLTSLITHRNRMRTLYNWMIAFFTNDNSLRMIIEPRSTDKPVLEEMQQAGAV